MSLTQVNTLLRHYFKETTNFYVSTEYICDYYNRHSLVLVNVRSLKVHNTTNKDNPSLEHIKLKQQIYRASTWHVAFIVKILSIE